MDTVGGLIGATDSVYVGNCYASGTVSGVNTVGGLVGLIGMSDMISDCYSSAAVSGTGMFIGGLIGNVGFMEQPLLEKDFGVGDGSSPIAPDGSASIKSDVMFILFNTYWDTQSSGQTTSAIEGIGVSEGKTTAEMMAQATFVGWDFTRFWSICEGKTYPFLLEIPNPYPQTPVEVTINQRSAQTDPVNTLPIVFDVVFSAPVTGFENGDVDFSAGVGVTAYTVTDTGDSMNFTVEVTGVSADGTIIASVPAAVAADACSTADNNISTSTDNAVYYDQTSPSVAITSVDPIAARDGVTVTVEVTASDAGGLDGVPSVTLNGDAMTHQGTVGDVYTYTLTLGAGSTEGAATIVASVDDLVGNPGSDTDTTSLTIDNTPPEINISAPSEAEVSTGGTVDFSVSYTGASSCSLTESDITLNVTGDVTASVAVLEVIGCTYTVTLSNFAGSGTAGFTIAANTAEDEAGNMAPSASTPTPVTVTLGDITPPVINTCPEDIGVEATPDNQIPDVTGDVEATDDVTAPEDLIITQDPAAGTAAGPGEHVITISVEDEAGNINNSCTVTFTVSTYHPADLNFDNQITMAEAIIYLYGWQLGNNDIDFTVRVLFLWQHGELYHYDPSITSVPACWVND